jgi:hypothetical protein
LPPQLDAGFEEVMSVEIDEQQAMGDKPLFDR